MPPTGERRREIIGAADAFHDEAKLTQPLTPEQFSALLDALEEEGLVGIRLEAGLVGCFGLRPAELAVLEYRDGRLFVGKIKRNPHDVAKTARQQQIGGERMVGQLNPPGHEGLGMTLAAQWASGLVKLPRAIKTQINNGNLKATRNQFYRHLQRCRYWNSLVGEFPGGVLALIRSQLLEWAERSSLATD